jgi:hypothetical protein
VPREEGWGRGGVTTGGLLRLREFEELQRGGESEKLENATDVMGEAVFWAQLLQPLMAVVSLL